MTIQKKISLKPYNTFGIDVKAKRFLELNSLEEAVDFFTSQYDTEEKILILGGGSNILFTKDFDGLVLKNNLKGIEKIKEDAEHVWVEAMAGENWNEFVQYTLRQNWAGLENLSLIPGNVGASPMQNIGAYGVEVKSVIEKVKAIEMSSGKVVDFSAEKCEFNYRSSIFKTTHKNLYFITSVMYKLNKAPDFQISYGAIAEELQNLPGELSIHKIAQAVINIRRSKLPDPKVIGNAGSFFKNPVIEKEVYLKLSEQFPNMPFYTVGNEKIKLAAGWLIEQCGWKGKDLGGYGVHKKQSLVLVNYDSAAGNQIYQLSEEIIQSVIDRFGIKLEREVNVV